jgi:pantothenate kinase
MMFDRSLKQNEEMLKSLQSMMNLDAFEKAMMPMTDLLEFQRSMLESLAEEQIQLSTEIMADAFQEVRAVC